MRGGAVLIVCRILQGHVQLDKDFDRECAQTLAHRGSRQLEDGTYQFTRDLRVKSVSNIYQCVCVCVCVCVHNILSAGFSVEAITRDE